MDHHRVGFLKVMINNNLKFNAQAIHENKI